MKRARFLNCQIDFSKHNFSPRTETGFWVKKALKKLKFNKNLNVLDIFAGTGCIGIAILKACPSLRLRMDFVDIWPDAIEQIKINLKLNKIPKNRYKIFRSDLFKRLALPVLSRAEVSRVEGYDFIFANPPYVALERMGEVQKEVLGKEPPVALFSGKDGMVIIKKFLGQAKKYLKPSGQIFMEFDPLQKGEIAKILKKERFMAEFKKDQFGKIRWLEAGLFAF